MLSNKLIINAVICRKILLFQATPMKDVVISEKAPTTLLLQKHADFIAAYGTKKDDYVSILSLYSFLWQLLFAQ